jgi:hypothetical protein
MSMFTPAVITAPTCRFKTKRPGYHLGIVRADICGDCLSAMQASLLAVFNGGPVFCHECGCVPQAGDLLSYIYRDTEAMLLCEPCRVTWAAKLTSELDAERSARESLIIRSVNAREAIATAPTVQRKLTLWEQWRAVLGPRRRV